jgi:SAM-dependent methyltransferase
MIGERLNGQVKLTGLDPSPPMLEVGQAAADREGIAITWQQGRAEELPFPDASFDLVTIQQGLQYFQDKVAGLREIRRVLVPGGRVVSATWTEIEHNPFNLVFAEIIERHVGSPAMHTPFALGNQELLRSLFVDAGFDDINIEVVDRENRFPSPDRFITLGIAGASAAVPALQAMTDEERSSLIDALRVDLEEPLRQFTKDDVIVAPLQAHIVVGYKTG